MQLTITAAIHARWGHRVDGLIHTHAWMVEATLEGPADSDKVFPADDLEQLLLSTVAPWHGHYLTDEDIGEWKGYKPLVWHREPTVEEIVRRLWSLLDPVVPGFDRSRSGRKHRIRSLPDCAPAPQELG